MRQIAVSYQRLGQLALVRRAYAKAEAHFRTSLAHFEQVGKSPEIPHVLLDLSRSLLRQNQLQPAVAQCLCSLHLAIHAQMTPRIVSALTLLAQIRAAEARKEEAVTLLHMVHRHAQVSSVSYQIATKLQTKLAAELDVPTIQRSEQAVAGKSLQEFGCHQLQQECFNCTKLNSQSAAPTHRHLD